MHRKNRSDQEQNFWISYADLMAGLLFVFILLIGAIVVKTVLMRSDLQAIRTDLQQHKRALGLSEKALAEKKKKLREIQKKLMASREENVHISMELARLQSETERLRLTLDNTEKALAERQAELDEKSSALSLTRKEMDELKALLLETENAAKEVKSELETSRAEAARLQEGLGAARKQHEEDLNRIKLREDEVAQLEKALLIRTRAYQQAVEDLNLTRIKIKNLTGIKVKVVQRLKDRLGDSIRIDPKSGAVRFSSNILFNQGEAVLKPEARQELSRILGRYIDTLISDPQMRRYIDLITIEGHTNSDGTYLYNLQLSQQRALAVMEFLYQQYPKNRALFRRYLSASGRSYAEPILGSDGREDKEASRRIEIKFRIRNEEAVRELMNYLDKERIHAK